MFDRAGFGFSKTFGFSARFGNGFVFSFGRRLNLGFLDFLDLFETSFGGHKDLGEHVLLSGWLESCDFLRRGRGGLFDGFNGGGRFHYSSLLNTFLGGLVDSVFFVRGSGFNEKACSGSSLAGSIACSDGENTAVFGVRGSD